LLATLMVFLPQLIGDGMQTIEALARSRSCRASSRIGSSVARTRHSRSSRTGSATRSVRLAAAAIAEGIGVRGAIAVGWAGMAVSLLFLIFSPLPRVRTAAEWRSQETATA
jgi:hypothetical protein